MKSSEEDEEKCVILSRSRDALVITCEAGQGRSVILPCNWEKFLIAHLIVAPTFTTNV